MAKVAKIQKPDISGLDINGLMRVLQEFHHKMGVEMRTMITDGTLDGWEDPKNDLDFQVAMGNEIDPVSRAVLAAVCMNFIEEPEPKEQSEGGL